MLEDIIWWCNILDVPDHDTNINTLDRWKQEHEQCYIPAISDVSYNLSFSSDKEQQQLTIFDY